MKSDTLILSEGMLALQKMLGLVDAEKFITLIHREKFDYTEWQEHLFEGLSVEELAQRAQQYWNNNYEFADNNMQIASDNTSEYKIKN